MFYLPCTSYPCIQSLTLRVWFWLTSFFFKIRSQFKDIQLIVSFISRTFAALHFAGLLAPPDVQISLHRVERCRSGRFSTDPLGGRVVIKVLHVQNDPLISIDIHWIYYLSFCLAHDASFCGKMILVGHVCFHAWMQIRVKKGEAGGNFVTYVLLVGCWILICLFKSRSWNRKLGMERNGKNMQKPSIWIQIICKKSSSDSLRFPKI